MSEFNKALRKLSKKKVSEIDNLSTGLLNNAEENVIDRFYQLRCKMYEEGVTSMNFQKNRIVIIPKKMRTYKCETYRVISLLSHTTKVFSMIIRNIKYKIE